MLHRLNNKYIQHQNFIIYLRNWIHMTKKTNIKTYSYKKSNLKATTSTQDILYIIYCNELRFAIE